MNRDTNPRARRRHHPKVLSIALLLLPTLPFLLASSEPVPGTPQGTEGQKVERPNRYIGVLRCKNCHQAKESGDQYGHWTESKHSKAYRPSHRTMRRPRARSAA